MADTEIKVTLKWFPIAKNLQNPARARALLKEEFERAGEVVGMTLERNMRRVIQAGRFQPNAPMTVALKGSSKPLIGPGEPRLWKAITHKVQATPNGASIHVGVMRTHREANIARIVTEGRVVTVTRRMEIMFRVLRSIQLGYGGALTSERARQLFNESKGQFPVLQEGSTFAIPARNFGLVVLRDPETKRVAEREFSQAVMNALKRLKAGGA